MSRECELTGTKPMVGHRVSHSQIKTKRIFRPNLVRVTLHSEALNQNFPMRITASALRTADSRDEVERQARNAWQALVTARENHRLLTNQSNIAAEFLEQARKERQLGRRSLLDVLSGETSLINASSDAAAAKANVAVAVYTLLTVMGELDDKAFAK